MTCLDGLSLSLPLLCLSLDLGEASAAQNRGLIYASGLVLWGDEDPINPSSPFLKPFQPV